MHQLLAHTLDLVIAEIKRIQADARTNASPSVPRGPSPM
jgi:hypothetical protein